MNNKILESKIQIPNSINYVIPRDELIQEMIHSTDKIMILHAGAGFGKTTLLIDYANVSKDYSAWYHISSLDNDLLSFIKYMEASILKAMHVNDEDKLINPLEFSDMKSVESLAYDFSIYIEQFSRYKLTVLLDDFQEITNVEIFMFLTKVIHNVHENFRLIIATKGQFPSFMARFVLESAVFIVREKQLSFNLEEIMAVFTNMQVVFDIETVAKEVFEYTQGWPAGVMAITIALNQERRVFNDNEITALCQESQVYDYLVYEIFNKLPYEIQQFLVKSSALNILSVDLCDAVLGINNSKSILDYVLSENLFILKLSGRSKVYRYHSIFKDYLDLKLHKDDKLNIQKKAAIYCKNNKDYEQAAEYSMSCCETELLKGCVVQLGNKLIASGQTHTLGSWITYLDEYNSAVSGDVEIIISNYFYEIKDINAAFDHINNAIKAFEYEGFESVFVQAILQKSKYFMDHDLLEKGIETIRFGISKLKSKHSHLWFQLYERLLELEIENKDTQQARKTGEAITTGDTHLIRFKQLDQVNQIKSKAKRYLQEFSEKENNILSILVACFDYGHVLIKENQQIIKWRTKKVEEMFLFLVDKNGKLNHKNVIIDALWPDVVDKKANTLFHTTLSYMRKNLLDQGLSNLVVSDTNGYGLNMECVETDIDYLYQQTQRLKGNYMDIEEDFNEVLEVFSASYLDHIGSPWVSEQREFMNLKLLNLFIQIAKYYMGHDDFAKSIPFLKMGVHLDPFSEEVLTLLLKAQSEIGDFKGAYHHFENAKQIYKTELDIELEEVLQFSLKEFILQKSESETSR